MPTIRRGLLDYDRPTIPADAGPDYSSKHKNKNQNPCFSAKIICAAWEARDSLEPSYRGPTRRRKPRRPLAGKKNTRRKGVSPGEWAALIRMLAQAPPLLYVFNCCFE